MRARLNLLCGPSSMRWLNGDDTNSARSPSAPRLPTCTFDSFRPGRAHIWTCRSDKRNGSFAPPVEELDLSVIGRPPTHWHWRMPFRMASAPYSGTWKPPIFRSSNSASRSGVRSSIIGPMSCTRTGRPSGDRPVGTAVAGRPAARQQPEGCPAAPRARWSCRAGAGPPPGTRLVGAACGGPRTVEVRHADRVDRIVVPFETGDRRGGQFRGDHFTGPQGSGELLGRRKIRAHGPDGMDSTVWTRRYKPVGSGAKCHFAQRMDACAYPVSVTQKGA